MLECLLIHVISFNHCLRVEKKEKKGGKKKKIATT